MRTTDYLVDLLLIALVLRQIRPRPLTASSVVLPGVLVFIAALNYLRPLRLGESDLVLIVLLTALGAALGLGSGLTTSVWRDGPVVMSRAGLTAALLWTTGMLARFAFAYYSTHSGQTAVERFSVAHQISSVQAWTTALVLMAIGEVAARVVVLQLRRIRSAAGAAAVAAPAASPALR